MRKLFALLLAVLLLAGLLAGCGKETAAPETEPTEPAPTQPPEEAGVLKVLTLGHSLAIDCGHMLALICDTEGFKEVKVGTLYYSGCPLGKHVQFMESDAPEYNLYLSSTEDAGTPPTIMKEVTMRQALTLDYWDVIVMQGGVFEIAEADTYTKGNIQKIQDFVNANKRNPLAIFAWHMPWAPPTDNTLRDTYPYDNNSYYTNYLLYGDNRSILYEAIAGCVRDHILTDDSFEFLIPTGTAIENALSSYLEEKDLHRDYVHASDLSRVIAAYVWYCRLAGVEQLEQIKLDTVPTVFFRSRKDATDWALTDGEKALILESVNNALKEPLKMTQSQFTTAP